MKLGNESVITNQNMKTRRADEEKNPRLYRVLLRKGGVVVTGSVVMTIIPIKLPKKSFVENFTLKLKSIFN